MTSTTTRGKRGAAEPASEPPLLSLARQVRGWADTLLRLAEALGCSLDYLVGRTDDPTPTPKRPRTRKTAPGD